MTNQMVPLLLLRRSDYEYRETRRPKGFETLREALIRNYGILRGDYYKTKCNFTKKEGILMSLTYQDVDYLTKSLLSLEPLDAEHTPKGVYKAEGNVVFQTDTNEIAQMFGCTYDPDRDYQFVSLLTSHINLPPKVWYNFLGHDGEPGYKPRPVFIKFSNQYTNLKETNILTNMVVTDRDDTTGSMALILKYRDYKGTYHSWKVNTSSSIKKQVGLASLAHIIKFVESTSKAVSCENLINRINQLTQDKALLPAQFKGEYDVLIYPKNKPRKESTIYGEHKEVTRRLNQALRQLKQSDIVSAYLPF